jgi:hypothetical protein
MIRNRFSVWIAVIAALENIRNTRRIFAVVQAGRIFSRADLDALLSGVRSAATH